MAKRVANLQLAKSHTADAQQAANLAKKGFPP